MTASACWPSPRLKEILLWFQRSRFTMCFLRRKRGNRIFSYRFQESKFSMPQGTTENVTVAFREMVFTGIDRGTMARRTSVALPHARRFTFDGSRRRISAHGLVDAKH